MLLHSGEEATIVEFLDKKMVSVDVNGVQFPVYLDQIDFPYYYRFSKKYQKEIINPQPTRTSTAKELPLEKKVPQRSTYENGLSFVFFPILTELSQDYLVDRFKIYLNNEFPYVIEFDYQVKLMGNIDYVYQGTVEAGQSFYLHDLLMESFNDNPAFLIDVKATEKTTQKPVQVSKEIKIKPKQLFAYLQELRLQGKASFPIQIVKEFSVETTSTISDPITFLAPKVKDYRSESSKKFEQSFQHIIDLHIEELVPNTKGMSNVEILRIQLDAFEKHIELAIQHHQPLVTVIHGVGKGTLKDAIHDRLKGNPFVGHYSDQFDPFYGNGATTIHFRY